MSFWVGVYFLEFKVNVLCEKECDCVKKGWVLGGIEVIGRRREGKGMIFDF